MYIYAKAGRGNEYLYGVNFTRIKYLRATACPAANTRVLRDLRKALSYNGLRNKAFQRHCNRFAKEPLLGCEMGFFG